MSSTATPDEVRVVFKGVLADFMADQTRHIDLEGAFRSGKTTGALWKVYQSCIDHPGIQWLICRYSDGDTQSKLKPSWRLILAQAGIQPDWDAQEMCDVFPEAGPQRLRSKVYIFGLKAQDQISRYGKLRGIGAGGVAGIYNDQTEELPHDIFLEFMGRLSQPDYPHQLLLTPNPPDENHWLTKEFPEKRTLPDRKYYSVPIYANAHNLAADTIRGLEQAYPPMHPKHRSAVLGKRGLNVIGTPVYGGDPLKGLAPMFLRTLHERPVALNPHLPLCEAIDFGKHCPCIVWAQFTPYGGIHFLGGVLGQDLFLKDFLPIALQVRAQWFPGRLSELTCCDPAGSHDNSQGIDQNGITVLKAHGFNPRYVDNANSPAIRGAMIERLAGYMRTRTPQGEAFAIVPNDLADPRWVIASADAVEPSAFLADGFEAGYVWDAHMISVGSKQMRRPKKDGWYEHGQNCAEYLELSFGGAQPSVTQVEQSAIKLQKERLRLAQLDAEPDDYRRGARRSSRRGGY